MLASLAGCGYEYAELLIQEGKAYVDDLTREEMQAYRGQDAGKPSKPSPYRDRSPEENLRIFCRLMHALIDTLMAECDGRMLLPAQEEAPAKNAS